MKTVKFTSLVGIALAVLNCPDTCHASVFSPSSLGQESSLLDSIRRRLQTAGSQTTCTDLEAEMENIQGTNGEIIYECSCAETPDVDGYTLSCVNNCEYCKADGLVCVTITETIVIDGNSAIQERLTQQTYTRGGRSDVITYNVTNCDSNFLCEACEINVGSTKCEVCQLNVWYCRHLFVPPWKMVRPLTCVISHKKFHRQAFLIFWMRTIFNASSMVCL